MNFFKAKLPIFFIFSFILLFAASPSHAQISISPCVLYPSDPHCIDPVVLVPGLVTSFNIQTLFRDQPSDNWRFVPLGNIYQGLINRLQDTGYTPGYKLFIAHYDWRQPNAESANEYLIPAIEEAKAASGKNKVDIIAHSMGGLVAREYIQGPNYQDDVDELIMLGAPDEGAADAYVAWEGGIIPERWDVSSRWYIKTVEWVLKHTRDTDLEPPLSFRAFFPSLKDLLPTIGFVSRDGSSIAIDDLTEQNTFLQQLNNSLDTLTDRAEVTTIAGNNLQTLNTVPINNARTPEDIELARWRDGHPNPDPPQTDTIAGDQTVTLASALLGINDTTIDNAQHANLPEEAQEEVLEALIQDSSGPHFAYDKPASLLGTVVLSPVDPVITGPNGEVLSQNTNTFPEAEYVDDSTDPNGPKLLVIANPPEGNYDVTLTGTDSGDYAVITTYADEDETTSTTNEGTTSPGQTDTTSFTLANETFVADIDLVALTKELQQTIRDLFKAKHIKPRAFGALYGNAARLHANAQIHQRLAEKFGDDHKLTQRALDRLRQAFDRFSRLLNEQIERGLLDEVSAPQLISLRDQIATALP